MGDEYISKIYDNYCSKYGIKHQKSITRALKYNEVEKWMNYTIDKPQKPQLRWSETI